MQHTNEVVEAAEEKIQQQEEREEAFEPLVTQEPDGRYDAEPPIETLNELYGKVIFADGRSQYLEINKELPTGYLTEDEIRWLHGLQDIVRICGVFEDMGIPVNGAAKFVQRKMDFITMVSKSRQGFAIKEISQNRIESDERIETQEGQDEPGLIDKFKNMAGSVGGAGGGQVIGKPDYGSYTGAARERSAQSRPSRKRRKAW